MTDRCTPSEFDCRRAERAIHQSLDGDRPGPADDRWLLEHLAACPSCERFREDMQRIQGALRTLPEETLPGPSLDEVWKQTTAAGPGIASRPARVDWRVASAAAVLILAVVGLWIWDSRSAVEPPVQIAGGPSEAQMHRAADEARMVLGLTSRALRRTEQAAIHGVLGDEIAGALQRVPVSFPPTESSRPTETEP